MRRTIRLGLGMVLVAATAFFGTPPAQASIGQCADLYACLWGENSYSGCFVRYINDTASFGNWATCGSSANNGANSVRNQDLFCNVVFFENTSYGGAGILFNNVSDGFNYQDPTLSNGGGVGYGGNYAGQNWQDRISSLRFCN